MPSQPESSSKNEQLPHQLPEPATAPAAVQMHAAHVDPLYPDHLRVLCQPFEVFRFDFASPPGQDGAQHLQVLSLCLHNKLKVTYGSTNLCTQSCKSRTNV